MAQMMRYTMHASPIGELLLAGEDDVLALLGFPSGSMARRPEPDWRRDDAAFAVAREQLDAYFAAELRDFDLPLAPRGTAFQLQVWQALRAIPYGSTCTYAALASAIGKPSAMRAVGNANGRNPLPIIVPCHRVIGRDGSLTGFGGGLPTKAFLLALERRGDARGAAASASPAVGMGDARLFVA